MTTLDESIHPRDIRDTDILTALINDSLDIPLVYNVPFAPLVTYTERQVRLVVRTLHTGGLAAFRSDDGYTPIMAATGEVREIFMDLLTIAEKDPIKASELIKLNSSDRSIAFQSMRTVVERGTQLYQRNMQRTKWLAWQAAKDALSITYPDGGAIAVDFGLNDTTSDLHKTFSASHTPTAGTHWDFTDGSGDYTADIIGDIQTWSGVIALDAGVPESECTLYVNSLTAAVIRKNAGLKAQVSSSNPRIITPTMPEIAQIVGLKNIVVYNDFYEDSANAMQRYIPTGYGVLTGPNQINGRNIMEVKDGPVVVYRGGELVVESNPGMRTEIFSQPDPPVQYVRLQTARMPVMYHPAAFMYCTLYT